MPEYHQAVYVISVAAELAGVHPQTLRIYERKGLVEPGRTQGGSPPLQRRRHRAAPTDPGPDQRGTQPGRGQAGAGAGIRDRPDGRGAPGAPGPCGRRRGQGPPPVPTRSGAPQPDDGALRRRSTPTLSPVGPACRTAKLPVAQVLLATALLSALVLAVAPPARAQQQRQVVVVGDSIVLGAQAPMVAALRGAGLGRHLRRLRQSVHQRRRRRGRVASRRARRQPGDQPGSERRREPGNLPISGCEGCSTPTPVCPTSTG